VVEEERWLVEFSFPGSTGGLLLHCFVLALIQDFVNRAKSTCR
jgi:hypothetical protein